MRRYNPKGVSRKSVLREFEDDLKELQKVLKNFHGCFKENSNVFYESFVGVLRVLQGNVKGLIGCFKSGNEV